MTPGRCIRRSIIYLVSFLSRGSVAILDKKIARSVGLVYSLPAINLEAGTKTHHGAVLFPSSTRTTASKFVIKVIENLSAMSLLGVLPLSVKAVLIQPRRWRFKVRSTG